MPAIVGGGAAATAGLDAGASARPGTATSPTLVAEAVSNGALISGLVLWFIAYTRLTTARPKSPLGFTVSTATMMNSAMVSLSSRPT